MISYSERIKQLEKERKYYENICSNPPLRQWDGIHPPKFSASEAEDMILFINYLIDVYKQNLRYTF